jgi:tRNA threonylcarbamoyladenosine biosynthesis protein TsaB
VLVLALDTTTRGGSVVVVRGDIVLARIAGDASRTHGERLPGELEAALTRAGVAAQDLDLLAVCRGPGAFTGLRIGLAAIQGLAMVIGKPVVGVSALDALADTVRHADPAVSRVAAWMDAQRGEVFAASYAWTDVTHTVEASEPTVGVASGVLGNVPFARDEDVTFAGDGALRYRVEIEQAWGNRAHFIDPVPALAPAIARLGQRLAAAGRAGPPHTLQPLYVRRSDAELDRARQTNV